MTFIQKLAAAWQQNDTLLCVGLDPDSAKLPAHLQGQPDGIYTFCKAIIDATADVVCAFKPQIAYFSALRAEDQLEALCREAPYNWFNFFDFWADDAGAVTAASPGDASAPR